LARATIHGYFDGELDAVRSSEFERHLETCVECQQELQKIESLSTALRRGDLYERASHDLRAKVRKQVESESGVLRPASPRSRPWLFLPALAGLAAVAAALVVAFLLIQPRNHSTQIAAEIVDAHVRSLQPGHLTDVLSTDQHTVKPWFDGKLDFIPPVTDYAEQGFPLVGGRLDVVDGHNVAAVVYSRRKHVVNLFAWPGQVNETVRENSGSRQGYNWILWSSRDMRFCLVSDAGVGDLRALQQLIGR
jgi:anti-sigma factor RsiW